jgi:hypothetical protein
MKVVTRSYQLTLTSGKGGRRGGPRLAFRTYGLIVANTRIDNRENHEIRMTIHCGVEDTEQKIETPYLVALVRNNRFHILHYSKDYISTPLLDDEQISNGFGASSHVRIPMNLGWPCLPIFMCLL